MQEFFKKVKLIGAAIVALLVIIIVLQNTESVETRILFVRLVMPRAAMLFGTLLIGFAPGCVVGGAFDWASKKDGQRGRRLNGFSMP